MNEHWDALIKGVELQEKRALVEDIFFNVLVIDPLQLQCPYHPVGKRASPEPQKLYFLLRHEMILAALTANNEIYLGLPDAIFDSLDWTDR